MYIEVEKNNIVKIIGKLNADNLSQVENHLTEILYGKNRLFLDLTQTEQLDMAGVYMLFQFRKKAFEQSKEVSIIINDRSKIKDTVIRSGLIKVLDSAPFPAT